MHTDCFVAGLVERLLGTVAHGRIVIASLDDEQRLLGVEEVAIASSAQIEHCGWELRTAVAHKATGVIVGYHSANPSETALFARTIGATLAVAVVAVVVAPSGARQRQHSDVVPSGNGWLRRSTG